MLVYFNIPSNYTVDDRCKIYCLKNIRQWEDVSDCNVDSWQRVLNCHHVIMNQRTV
jgi:hypothetical protein